MRIAHFTSLAACLSAALASPLDLSPRALAARDVEIDQFERRYLDTLGWEHANDTVKLVGYKKIILTDTHLNELHDHVNTSPAEWEQTTDAYYDPYERTMRVYFPVENALVYHGDELVEASHLGEYPAHDRLHGDCHVVGRYKTDQIHGTKGNRVEGGIVYLDEPAAPVRVYGDSGNVLMYDFGWRGGPHGHGHGHGKREGDHEGGSCIENHGGKTCSEVYGINNGGCPRDYSSCIDYNGGEPNCVDKSGLKAFVGSDCYTSVKWGHCWSEMGPAAWSYIKGSV